MNCSKCQNDFEERLIEGSHDIPKYLGGTDLDGRHWLCRTCHREYELIVLIKCLNFIGEHPNLDDWGDQIYWMKILKDYPEQTKRKLRYLASKIKEDFFKDE